MTCQSCQLTRHFIQSSLNFKIHRFRFTWFQSIENFVLILSRSNTAQSVNFKSHYQQYKLPHQRSQLKTLNWSNTTKIHFFSKIFRGLTIFIQKNPLYFFYTNPRHYRGIFCRLLAEQPIYIRLSHFEGSCFRFERYFFLVQFLAKNSVSPSILALN